MIYYRGAKGKAIYFSIDKAFYHSLVSNLTDVAKGISMGVKGYLYNGNHAVTRMVLGLEKGDLCKTSKHWCHNVPGLYEKLDNKERVLKMGTKYDNNKDQLVKVYIWIKNFD